MLKIEVNEKKYNCPVCWDEVSVAQYQRLVSSKDAEMSEVFSLLIDLPNSIVDSQQAEDLMIGIYQVTAFVFNEEKTFTKNKVPKFISLSNVEFSVEQCFDELTVAQAMAIRTELIKAKDNNKPLESLISKACAICLQPQITGRAFNTADIKEIEAIILNEPIYKWYALGFFILAKQMKTGANGLALFHQLQMKVRRIKNLLTSRGLNTWSHCMI